MIAFQGHDVALRPVAGDGAIGDAEWLSMFANGFDSQQQVHDFGVALKSSVRLAAVRANFGRGALVAPGGVRSVRYPRQRAGLLIAQKGEIDETRDSGGAARRLGDGGGRSCWIGAGWRRSAIAGAAAAADRVRARRDGVGRAVRDPGPAPHQQRLPGRADPRARVRLDLRPGNDARGAGSSRRPDRRGAGRDSCRWRRPVGTLVGYRRVAGLPQQRRSGPPRWPTM